MRFTARTLAALAAITTTPISACSSDTAGPSNGLAPRTAAAAVDSALETGTSRIEIHLFPGELVAREVHVEADDQEEKIVSGVTAIDPQQGTVSLELGGLTIAYGAGARFRTEIASNVSRSAWETAIESELAAGGRPLIEARRNPPGSPQAPDDPTFVAADLRLASGAEAAKIELYLDGDNLQSGTGTSEAALRVLGLTIEVNDRTRLGADNVGGVSAPAGAIEFEMGVASVDPAGGRLTLTSGTVVLVPPSTVISGEGDLLTLQAAADAVAAGRPVRAEGWGTVESAGPPVVISATSLKIEVDD